MMRSKNTRKGAMNMKYYLYEGTKELKPAKGQSIRDLVRSLKGGEAIEPEDPELIAVYDSLDAAKQDMEGHSSVRTFSRYIAFTERYVLEVEEDEDGDAVSYGDIYTAPYTPDDQELPPMTTDARRKANAKYDAAHTTQIVLKLNNGTDADILEKLNEVPNRQGYIKNLIRKDLERDE